MNLLPISPKKALNKAFLRVKPYRKDIEVFKKELKTLLERIEHQSREEFIKGDLKDFLQNTYYRPDYYLNIKEDIDLVIHNGKTKSSPVGVIIEIKSPINRAEMAKPDNLNVKALHELILYYLRERIHHNNVSVKHLIITDVYEWFIFDGQAFEKLFFKDKNLVQQFKDFEAGSLVGKDTKFFYEEIARPFVATLDTEIPFTYFDLRDYEKPLRNDDKEDDKKLIALFKILSTEHLLKQNFINDSNSLDKSFYNELLHIIGLEEVKEGGKKLIQRKKEKDQNPGSLLEETLKKLKSIDSLSGLKNLQIYGATTEDRLFNVGVELVITWVNRILFLKLLESQLKSYHLGDRAYEFMNPEQIKGFDDLQKLFFQVLAIPVALRDETIQKEFVHVPYLNSSLFAPSDGIEKPTAIFISSLDPYKKLPLYKSTVLKDKTGKRQSGELPTLEYLLTFLNAYDFSSENNGGIQEDARTLINSSVLGLIFEKINGYKDGSIFTPGFITMYMSREAVRKAVVQKFNEVKGWNCTNLNDVFNKIEDIKEANEIINSLKVCDPAVGSGHLLVSILNEIIAVKSDLKILMDKEGRRLKNYHIEVVNDELMITDEQGDFFEYHPNHKESQRVQETLFEEKRAIIENCLFGVDINPNSVKICRLRLWIELLKNAYYKSDDGQLRTLPNIDINIKCGNSLVSRFGLQDNLKGALKKSKWTIESYKSAVATYHNAKNKEEKRAMEELILKIKQSFSTEIRMNNPLKTRLDKLVAELYQRFTGTFLFVSEPENEEGSYGKKAKNLEKQRKKEQASLEKEINQIQTKIDEIKGNKIYENAFEWRFEFPEVLNEDGDFMGFDIVIANPPYIRQEEIKDLKPYLESHYEIYHSIADLLTYFIELGYRILKSKGIFKFIISNKFTRTDYGKVMRQFLLDKTELTHFLDFSGIAVFDEATVDAAILGFNKVKAANDNSFVYADVSKEKLDILNFEQSMKPQLGSFLQKDLNVETWAFESPEVLAIKKKVEAQGIKLEDWNATINYGIKTGYNQAFIIDGEKRKALIEQDPKSVEIIKPLLRGRDIQKWQADFQDLWLIATFPSKSYRIDDFPAIKEYLKSFGNRLEQSGEKDSRKKTSNKWFETQDNIAYWEDFEKPKIIYPNMTKFMPFVIDIENHFYHNDKSFHIVTERIFWLGAFLNSKLFKYCFKDNFPELLGGTRELRKVFFDKTPVKQLSEKEETPFKDLVNEILSIKKSNPAADTTKLEAEIDRLIYQVYDLTEEEIELVEGEGEL